MKSIDGATEQTSGVLDSGSGPQAPRPAHDDEIEEEAARAAIQDGIRPYPDRETMLQRAFGLGAGAFLNHLVFWSGKGHGIGGDTGWLYKTLEDWDRERALSRRQVDRARAKLAKAGVLEETRHWGNRVYYRIRWARLAVVLHANGDLPRSEHDGASPRRAARPARRGPFRLVRWGPFRLARRGASPYRENSGNNRKNEQAGGVWGGESDRPGWRCLGALLALGHCLGPPFPLIPEE